MIHILIYNEYLFINYIGYYTLYLHNMLISEVPEKEQRVFRADMNNIENTC